MFKLHGPASILKYQQKHKVATKTIPYERYGKILFQKVASGHLLHFVQDGSSKNALYNYFFCKNVKNQKFSCFSSIYFPPNSRSTALSSLKTI